MKVIGVSGSPIKNSNTDRAVKAVLEATGAETEFIKLKDYTVAPCQACLGCVETNVCVIKDDGIELAEKVKSADALIIGGFTPYSTLDSRTKAFIWASGSSCHDEKRIESEEPPCGNRRRSFLNPPLKLTAPRF